MQVLLRFVPLRPAAVNRATGQGIDADVDNLHDLPEDQLSRTASRHVNYCRSSAENESFGGPRRQRSHRCLMGHGRLLYSMSPRTWRNWQTRRIEGPVPSFGSEGSTPFVRIFWGNRRRLPRSLGGGQCRDQFGIRLVFLWQRPAALQAGNRLVLRPSAQRALAMPARAAKSVESYCSALLVHATASG